MRLSTSSRRNLLPVALLGLMGALVTGACLAAETPEPAKVAIATCPVAGGVDATPANAAERADAPASDAASSTRPLDWRAMLPAVTLRSRY